MKTSLKIIVAAILIVAFHSMGFAMSLLDIEDMNQTDPATLANILIGAANVVPGSASFTGAPVAAGTFINANEDGINIERGVILSTGDVLNAAGPNNNSFVGTNNFRAGDAALNALVSPRVTRDAAVLEFSFIPPPTRNAVTFTYVFASDEYPEAVGRASNDVFGIFAGPVGGVLSNIARVPGTANPVSINTLNATATPLLFNNNCCDFTIPPFQTQYDGFSRVLSATAIVTPGIPHRVRLAIADAGAPPNGNGSIDSAVFIAPAAFSTVALRSISGQVTGLDSRGLPGPPMAGVTITATGAATATTTTDVNGNYTLTNLPSGAYTLTPSRAGFIFTPVSRAVTIANANVVGQNFVGRPGTPAFSISGTVTLSGGGPMAGVVMTLSGAATGAVITNATGAYAFTGLANGNYTVTPSLAGFSFTPASRAVTISGTNATGRNFVGTPGASAFTISGTVTTQGTRLVPGVPVPGVAITLSGAANASTVTDNNGSFIFIGLGNGIYTITPTQTGRTFTPVNRTVTINNANVTGQNFIRN